MKGHETIIKARMNGVSPKIVFINDYPCSTDWFDNGDHATVCTHGDTAHSLDFRFLFGLKVSITAGTEARAKDLFNRIKSAGATTVAACHVDGDIQKSHQSGWTEIWHKAAA